MDTNFLDDLVEDYLRFRLAPRTLISFQNEKITNSSDPEKSHIKERILSAFSNGNYPILLQLWDSLVIKYLPSRSLGIVAESNKVEFLINIHCAIFPFRTEVLHKAKEPDIAARVRFLQIL